MLCIRSIEVIAASASEKELVKNANVMEIAEQLREKWQRFSCYLSDIKVAIRKVYLLDPQIKKKPARPGLRPSWSLNTVIHKDTQSVTHAPSASSLTASHLLATTKFNMAELLSLIYL
jgi:hypothetical protein